MRKWEEEDETASGSRVGEKQGTPRRNPSTASGLPGHLVALGPRTISSSRESLVSRGEWAPADLWAPRPPPSSTSGLGGARAEADRQRKGLAAARGQQRLPRGIWVQEDE